MLWRPREEEQEQPDQATMITISAFNDREEALIGKALLEASGIPVTVREESDRLYLLVRETDAQQAQAVLAGPEPRSRRRIRYYPKKAEPDHPNLRRLRDFLVGGAVFTAAVLVLFLLLIPLGLFVRVTPFVLVFLFVFGGCGGVIARGVRIRPKRRLRRTL